MITKVIQYYYDLYPQHIDKEGDRYFFAINGDNYSFEQQIRSEEELNAINQINKNMNLYNQIVLNKFNNLISNYGNYNYLLIKIIKPIRTLTMDDILNTVKLNNDKNNNVLLRNNWGLLWKNKIDNIEYQQNHIINKFPLIDQSLGYYIGMSESAISYFEDIEKNNISYYVSHIRVRCDRDTLDFYNPQNIIIDNRARDIAGYLKSIFIANNYSYNMIGEIIETAALNDLELKLLFCRLNYPSFYFDIYDQIINKVSNEGKLNEIIERNNEFKVFLKNIYLFIRKKTNIKTIEWITK